MLSEREVSAAVGSTAYGTNGDKLGTVEHFFVDDRTGAPTWVSVITGLFGTRHSIVPAVDATFDGGSLHLPVTTDAVKSAPALAGEHLDPAEEAELRRHYGIQGAGAQDAGIQDAGRREPGLPEREPAAGAPGWLPPVPPPAEHRHEDADLHSGPVDGGRRDDRPPDDRESTRAMAAPTQEIPAVPPPPPDVEHGTEVTDGAMTRSEERLVVGTERVATTRARLVKYVVTEEVQITVPIRREEIRVEEVPLDAPDPGPGESLLPADHLPAGDRARAGDYTPGGYDTGGYQVADGLPDEIVLHTERPVVSVEVVPVERVRLRTETVEGQERVTERVQREQIVLDESPSPRLSPK
jgi:stress response protein YsnF